MMKLNACRAAKVPNVLQDSELSLDILLTIHQPEPAATILALEPSVDFADGSVNTTRLHVCASAAWATFSTKQLPVDVVRTVGLQLPKYVPEEQHVLLVIGDHIPDGLSLTIEDPEPQAGLCLDLPTDSQHLTEVVELVAVEQQTGLRHLVGVDGGDGR